MAQSPCPDNCDPVLDAAVWPDDPDDPAENRLLGLGLRPPPMVRLLEPSGLPGIAMPCAWTQVAASVATAAIARGPIDLSNVRNNRAELHITRLAAGQRPMSKPIFILPLAATIAKLVASGDCGGLACHADGRPSHVSTPADGDKIPWALITPVGRVGKAASGMAVRLRRTLRREFRSPAQAFHVGGRCTAERFRIACRCGSSGGLTVPRSWNPALE